tara:strand:+ start:7155 stop:8918 length:1764 start_codon:yes stop_codon:yes gene_type:complete
MKFTYLTISIFLLISILFSQNGNTPTNLQIDAATLGGVQLSWDVPENFRRDWITHSNLNYSYGIGAGGTEHFVCQKFPDSMLTDYHGMLVKEIAFVPSGDANFASFQPLVFETDPSLIIYEIPDIASRSNLVLSASALSFPGDDLVLNAWNSIELKDHVSGFDLDQDIDPSTYTIDSTKSIWFGYWVYNYDNFPSGADVGPANEGLGNVIIWCPEETGCYEATLYTSSYPNLSNGFMIALSLINSDGADTTSRSISLSNNNLSSNNTQLINIAQQQYTHNEYRMKAGPIRDITIAPLEDLSRDISNYFVFENGQVADVVQPTYMNFNTSIREQTILGEREPGYYEFWVRAQTADGLSDSSNIVSIEIVNNIPSTFSLISPEDGTLISVNQSNINNSISFIWTNSVDIDGQDLYFILGICNESGDLACYDTTLIDRIYQVSSQNIIDSLGLSSGINLLSWSVFVTDGIDTVSSDDSTRYFTLDIDQLAIESGNIQPGIFSLHQNYPNPFNPVTTIAYELANHEFVSLVVYDVNGRLIKNLISEIRESGQNYTNWDGTNNANENVAGGVYIYQIDTESSSSTKKMILLK